MRRVVIQASAGSGKTFQLSSAYLGLLLSTEVGARPSEILATTFTRKAAGEIQARVLERLANAAAAPTGADTLGAELVAAGVLADKATVTQEHAQKKLAMLVSDFSQMRISTLDGVFNQIANAMGAQLGFRARKRLGSG